MKSLALLFLSAVALCAQSLTGIDLVNALRSGGYVIVMRHASSPREAPDASTAKPDNPKKERQLDDIGISNAIAMGRAIKGLRIPVGAVQSSPTYRALETARYAELGTPEQVPELGDNGQSMAGGTAAQAAWLKKRVTETPLVTNDFVITHMPNITAAFPDVKNVNDGDALVFGKGGQLVARISITAWPSLVKLGTQ
jgi:phosphohistidine phosphatase SixA